MSSSSVARGEAAARVVGLANQRGGAIGAHVGELQELLAGTRLRGEDSATPTVAALT